MPEGDFARLRSGLEAEINSDDRAVSRGVDGEVSFIVVHAETIGVENF